ncbi:hypothetical protein HBI25_161440 [Parastagonospora nodorum]|nr:hypothetical protein HBH47_154590 [Parastagonospora nodorum]KAH4219018.1 hypothetical protein HBI06_190550 [Parastagonospora nodorum]KAH4235576.1 hypothetical protein HBI05_150050 [Parastagonospora nodorum]KAH4255068.1 hypothetical protein HBI03_180460 [Parastagonospora nodorum]KAH4266868.1 hypothetical protein HBI04_175480 [Parastagonospora nodorum]
MLRTACSLQLAAYILLCSLSPAEPTKCEQCPGTACSPARPQLETAGQRCAANLTSSPVHYSTIALLARWRRPPNAKAHMGLGTVSAGAQANSLVVTFARDAAICGTASSCCCHYRPLRA